MAYLEDKKLHELKGKLATDEAELKSLYRSKKSEYLELSITHNQREEYEKKGWEVFKELKTKTKIRKEKVHSQKFEDDIWCQFYELGFRIFNRDETFSLSFGKDAEDTKQIDVIAADEETVFIIECKSSNKSKKAPSYKDEFELLKLRREGFRKSIYEIFGKDRKIKYIFATRNLRIDQDSEDMQRLMKAGAFYYNDNIYDYVNSLIKNYKGASRYQFLGLIFKNEKINNNMIELPALEGNMGGKKYYMFSIEPNILLKIGFILHRTKANENEMPTYQRLLVSNRLKGITKFINNGGYFPNSLILNFNQSKKIIFESKVTKNNGDSSSRIGILKIPNEYAIAYIIDGQHRLYGYADSGFRETNTIPVVAMYGLDPTEQLGIFMDINQNQKAVSPSLRLVLEEDLFWDADRADSRLKALRSSIVKQLSINSGPLYNKITIGEDTALLTFKPFADALLHSGLLPIAKINKYDEDSVKTALYDIHNTNHNDEMMKAKKKIVQLINMCYSLVEDKYLKIFEKEKYFIISNRGTYAFIMLIGSLNRFEIDRGKITLKSTPQDRFETIEKYLQSLLNKLDYLSDEETEKYLTMLGSSADIKWFRFFQSAVNEAYSEYKPDDLIDWKERQDEELQDKGRRYGENIEKFIKKTVLNNLKRLYDDNWELEIGKIKRECLDRALKEDEKNYKEGIKKEPTEWTEMFNINDYKEIIEKHWSKKKEDDSSFKSFDEVFSLDMGFGFNSKAEKIKWISHFNSYRNLWAHAGTKEKRLNKKEVDFLEKLSNHFK